MNKKMISRGLPGLLLLLAVVSSHAAPAPASAQLHAGSAPAPSEASTQTPSRARAVANYTPRLNPSPRMHFSLEAAIRAAPGPFTQVEGHVAYRVDTPACVPLTPVTGATVAPEERLPLVFSPAGDNAYKADVVLDRFLDEDYFGQGVCRWSVVGVTVELHHSKVTFSPALYKDDLLAGTKVVRFFSLKSYSRADNERIDIGATRADAFDNPDATFSISMQAKLVAPDR